MSTDRLSLRARVPGERTLLVDGLAGAVVTVVLSFVPLAPLVGGAFAGYLHRDHGHRVGLVSGALAAVVLGLVVGGLLVVTGALVPSGGVLGLYVAQLAFGTTVAAASAVLGTAGGVLGVAYVDRVEREGAPEGRPAPASASASRDG